jgi:hypothetical protein
MGGVPGRVGPGKTTSGTGGGNGGGGGGFGTVGDGGTGTGIDCGIVGRGSRTGGGTRITG